MDKNSVNQKLNASLIASFCIIILFSAVLTVVGIVTIRNIREDYRYTRDIPYVKVRLLKDAKTDFMTMRYRVANYIMNSGDADYIHNVANIQYNDAKQALYTKMDEYILLNELDERQTGQATESKISNTQDFKKMVAAYDEIADRVMELSIAGRGDEADEVLKSIIAQAESMLRLLDNMISEANDSIETISKRMDDTTFGSIASLVVLAALLTIFSIALSFFIVNAIKDYIRHIRDAEQAAEDASQMKSAFLANMSHEIRTPMNGIIGFTELALDDNISSKTRDYLGKIKLSSEGLLHMINDVLDISKIESGKMEMEIIPFSIHELFQVCQSIVTPKAKEKGITLFCYAEPEIGKSLLGDPTKLRQVLLNLLSNAVKFTNVGIVKLLSTVIEKTDDNITIHFEVKDSGIGMTPEQIERVFEPFAQADNSTTRKYGGTGLGLPLAKSFVDLMGGTLRLESTSGIGSKFSFDLTFAMVDAPVEAIPEAVPADNFKKPSFEGEVLVCEDNDMNRQVICGHLAKVGLDATVAVNGQECVDLVRGRMENNEKPFDLIFMDIHMPVMDGLEAAKELTKLGNTTPVVVLTANIMPNDRSTYRMFGMPDCLAKPFTARELWVCLLKYLMPVGTRQIDEAANPDSDEKMLLQLRLNFYKDNRETAQSIKAALESGDLKTAHRLAHTLKSVAGLIGKTALREAAARLERVLAEESVAEADTLLQSLSFELKTTLAELEKLPEIAHPAKHLSQQLDHGKAKELLHKLEPMLREGNTDCLDMTDELTGIPGTDGLIEAIEAFDFDKALEDLKDITSDWENGV